MPQAGLALGLLGFLLCLVREEDCVCEEEGKEEAQEEVAEEEGRVRVVVTEME